MALLGIAGAMALLLGIVRIYGVISHSMSQRRREIAISLALVRRCNKSPACSCVAGCFCQGSAPRVVLPPRLR
jgi:hypothetical protein